LLIFASNQNINSMKYLYISIILLSVAGLSHAQNKNFHDFSAETIDGEKISLSQFKGKKLLVVNTASKCGLTPQYEQLEELYETYGGEGFEIIGFPANNFGKQEPGTDEEIKSFCEQNYGVSFTMMSKISVKGDNINPIYAWLTQKEKNGVKDSEVSWNFQKYFIDEDGNLIDYVSPKTTPLDEKVISWVRK
jgi:glutathione peroxidase